MGIFGKFPDSWAWVGIVLAGMGIVMTSPSIIQMIWGRAAIQIEFSDTSTPLSIFLHNPPVQNRILRFLRIKRETIQSIVAEFRIQEAGSNKIIVPIRHARIYSDDDVAEIGNTRIALPPTYSVAASIVIITWDSQEKKAYITGDRLRSQLEIGEGYYIATIIIFVDGDPITVQRSFCW